MYKVEAKILKKVTEVKDQDLLYVDSTFFYVFSFPLLSGNRKPVYTILIRLLFLKMKQKNNSEQPMQLVK